MFLDMLMKISISNIDDFYFSSVGAATCEEVVVSAGNETKPGLCGDVASRSGLQ